MRVWRWPALLVLPALVVAAVVVERNQRDQAAVGPDPARLMPVVSAPGAPSSTWYCAGGTATGAKEGLAEQVVVLANAGDRTVAGRLTAYPSEGAPARSDFTLGPYSTTEIRVSDLVKAPYAAALVEVGGGEVGVQQELRGPQGRSVSPCASAPGSQWFFPAGTTRPGSKMVLSVFNPFPGDAVLDITFDTDDGTRTPQAYQGLVVPGGKLIALEVSEVVTLRNDVATTVKARSGRVVVDQIQASDGTGGTVKGLTVTLGATGPSEAWIFPDGVGAPGYGERFLLFNPNAVAAEVDVAVQLDDPALNGIAEPFDVRVPAGRYVAVDVFGDGRVPVGVAHQTLVRSRNGVSIVAEREISGTGQAVQPGLGYTIGSPLVATRWLAAIGSPSGTSGVAVIVANPSVSAAATVTVRSVADGRFVPVEGMDGVVLPPGGRRIFDLGGVGSGTGQPAVEVGSDQPVVAETRFGFREGDDLAYVMAAPVAGTLSQPPMSDLFGSASPETLVVGGEGG